MTVLQARAPALVATERGADHPPNRLHRTAAVLLPCDAVAGAVGSLPIIVGNEPATVTLLLMHTLVWVASVGLVGEYRLAGGLRLRIRRLALVALALPTAVLLMLDALGHSATTVAVGTGCLLTASLSAAARALILAAGQRGIRVRGMTHRVVVTGDAATLPLLLDGLQRSLHRQFHVVGACVTAGEVAALTDVPVVRGVDRCLEWVAEHEADAVVLAPGPSFSPRDVLRLRWELEDRDIEVFAWGGLLGAPAGRTALAVTSDLPLLQLSAPRRRGPSRVAKQVFDRCAAAVALVLLTPLLLALVVVVRADSPGPAIFRQVRVGKDDTRFRIWKLRTMAAGADARSDVLDATNDGAGPLFKMRRDPRVTRAGRWLRRSSLDELPQLINVVMGQMSLVGPRPALPCEVEHYHPDVRRRLVVTPGITGLWQVLGRSDLSWEESVRLDQEYVDNWSLWMDLMILARTVLAITRGRGAY